MQQKFLAAAAAAALALCSLTAQAAFDAENPSVIIAPAEYPGIVDAFILRGEYRQALEYAEQGLQKNPMSAQLKFQRCVALEKLGRTQDAMKGLRDLIAQYPEIPEPYNNLAVLLAKSGDIDSAESMLQKAIALRPKFALAYKNLGDVYVARAKAAYETSLSITPNQRKVKQKLEDLQALK